MTINQKFLYHFCGAGITTGIWFNRQINGTGSVLGINDALNGGNKIQSGTSDGNKTGADTNNFRQFDAQNAVCVTEFKRNSANGIARAGFTATGSDVAARAQFVEDASKTFKQLLSHDGSNGSTIDSNVAIDLAYHQYKMTLGSASIAWSIDKVLQTAKTTNLPTGKMMPQYHAEALSGLGEIEMLHYEAFNI